MARTSKAHTSEDIWHLSIDDLLAAPNEPARLTGRGPFVINLSTSTASIGPPPKGLQSFDGLHVYQLRRGPEGRPQFLLRLGIIATEVEADAILSGVLEHYPGATKDSADDDDRAAVAVKAHPAEPAKPAQPPAEKPPEARRPPTNAAPPKPTVAANPEEPIRWDIDELLPDLPVTRPSRREPLAPRETRAPRESTALRETPEVREPPTQTKSGSLAAEAPPSMEIEFSAPAPAEAAPTRRVVEELDYDPNAITHEVGIPTFTFEALDIEAPTAEAPTIEAHELDVITFEASTTETMLTEAPTVEAYALELLADEAPPAMEPTANEIHGLRVEQATHVATEPAAPPRIDESHATNAADAHDDDAISPQNPESAARAPTPPASPAWPIAASTTARPAQRPSPPPRVPVVEPAPSGAISIDSTQTIRALTPLELADDQASQWFSIQLALSEEHLDPEHVPSLDIFNEYRLYSVTGLDEDRVMHALRLGFFSSALAAEAVAGYLRGFFDSPCIKRVSLAERERFAEKGVTARKDIGETGMHAKIELAGPTLLPERHTQLSDSGKHRAPSSIWSRLVAPLKR